MGCFSKGSTRNPLGRRPACQICPLSICPCTSLVIANYGQVQWSISSLSFAPPIHNTDPGALITPIQRPPSIPRLVHAPASRGLLRVATSSIVSNADASLWNHCLPSTANQSNATDLLLVSAHRGSAFVPRGKTAHLSEWRLSWCNCMFMLLS